MLTEERQRIILEVFKEKEIVKINELVKVTNTSESTIRRDLTQLENEGILKRVHGGAKLLKGRSIEPSYNEKQDKYIDEKERIAKYAASLIEEGDCIYLDAGTTVFNMIKYIDKKDVIVVTNGLKHIDILLEKNMNAYIIGGKAKARTKAIIGVDALKNLERFRFDKCFMGMNGIDLKYGFTTPDSEESILKEAAISLSKKAYVLADESKFGEVAFVKVAQLDKAIILTNAEVENYRLYEEKTKIKVVTK
ncbi:DeoR family transcriptional regulator [Anaeromicrobium sediminis]|uniref:DeoR family transcriptional regulator n=1 Tax=Anaeromicrobium sediminis TaxID=1478221 RepID=A0A267MQ30_9FIRM|nr:DeoR family transcriptional regulator [Anaeromicrobium sediminis]